MFKQFRLEKTKNMYHILVNKSGSNTHRIQRMCCYALLHFQVKGAYTSVNPSLLQVWRDEAAGP